MAEEINGVPCEKLFGSIARTRENAELAQFRFSARNDWVEGTASRSAIYKWYGMGDEHEHVQEFSFEADHPRSATVTARPLRSTYSTRSRRASPPASQPAQRPARSS